MTKTQAEKVGKKTTRVVLNSKSVTFRCKSNSDGKDVRDIIQNAFDPEKVTRYNYDLEGFLTLGMSEWKEFRAKFSSSADAEDCYNEVHAAIKAYQDGSSDLDPVYNTDYSVTTTGTGASASKDWITYLVIGAALVAIILLLWKRKK